MLSEFFNFSFNPLSIIFISLILCLFLALFIAIFKKDVRKYLIKISILEEDEKPQTFLIWLISVMLIVRTIQVFLVQPFIVDGGSMLPTLETNNMLLIDKVDYRFNAPQRGDVVVFKFKMEGSDLDGKYFIKRLIAFPGERVIVTGNSTTVYATSGEKIVLDESYVEESRTSYIDYKYSDYTLKDDEYFVMGDNRAGSYDSRTWGPINYSQISGRALVRVFPDTELFPGKAPYAK